MPNPVDFRLIKPIKKINKLTNQIEYEIPCIVIKIGDKLDSKRYEIQIEHLDFLTGEKVINNGITYEKTIKLFEGFNKKPPFETTCRIVKVKNKTIQFIVYGLFNVGIMEKLYDVKGILNNDEQEILSVFKSYHEELLDWLLETPKKDFTNDYDDLLF